MTATDYPANDSVIWGRRSGKCTQGSMVRDGRYDRRYWWCHWSSIFDSFYRDGPVTFREDGSERSDGGAYITFPAAVVDDFGDLVPVKTFDMLESWMESRDQSWNYWNFKFPEKEEMHRPW